MTEAPGPWQCCAADGADCGVIGGSIVGVFVDIAEYVVIVEVRYQDVSDSVTMMTAPVPLKDLGLSLGPLSVSKAHTVFKQAMGVSCKWNGR